MHEFRRIALGEFMDDLEFGKEIASLFGLPTDELSTAEEALGDERLSQGRSVFANLGISMLLVSMIFLAFIALMILLIILKRKIKLSDKSKERINNLRKKVFFNPIIRYLLLNALKLNFSAFIVFKKPIGGAWDIVIGLILMVTLNAVPIFFFFLLRKNRSSLKEEKQKQVIGTLYAGKNTEKEAEH